MPVHKLVIGDQIALPITLKKNDATFIIDPGAQVKAQIVSSDHETALSNAVTLSDLSTGADWANSLIIVELSQADTSGINSQGLAIIEIEVIEAGVTFSWFATVNLVKGHIN